jgi:hypothetical protein
MRLREDADGKGKEQKTRFSGWPHTIPWYRLSVGNDVHHGTGQLNLGDCVLDHLCIFQILAAALELNQVHFKCSSK